MESFKIKIHSSVDLITNSSTVIFTYSEGSLESVKSMVNEMLKVFDKKETFEDLFYAGVFLEDDGYYFYDNPGVEIEDFSSFKLQILKGEIERPQWMIDVEDKDESHGTVLELYPKDEKYSELANKIISFLYSTHSDAEFDG